MALSRPYDECHSRVCVRAGGRRCVLVIPCRLGSLPLSRPLIVCLSLCVCPTISQSATVLGRLPHATVMRVVVRLATRAHGCHRADYYPRGDLEEECYC